MFRTGITTTRKMDSATRSGIWILEVTGALVISLNYGIG